VPYGIAKSAGGDTPANDAKMERCVQAVMAKNPSMDKVSAIKVCKSSGAFGGPRGRSGGR
jgi:hypothetical protein